MFKIEGTLTVKSIDGRNGAFNVGDLVTPVGKFSVKSSLLEEFAEGTYSGEFVISWIGPAGYPAYGGKYIVEVRAEVDEIIVDSEDRDPVETQSVEIDPLDEESTELADDADEDAEGDFGLFGDLWPLGDTVKLDKAADRSRLRKQAKRLDDLGYRFDSPTQTWRK